GSRSAVRPLGADEQAPRRASGGFRYRGAGRRSCLPVWADRLSRRACAQSGAGNPGQFSIRLGAANLATTGGLAEWTGKTILVSRVANLPNKSSGHWAAGNVEMNLTKLLGWV